MSSGIFLGRGRSMDQLCRTLDHVLARQTAPILPQVVLISGQGGIGKTTLLLELQALVEREHRGLLQNFRIDWQNEKQLNPGAFSVPPDQLDPRILFQALERTSAQLDRWEKHQKAYQQVKSSVQEALAAAVQAASMLSLEEVSRPTRGGRMDFAAETVSGALSTVA